jgi:hypothetical protein
LSKSLKRENDQGNKDGVCFFHKADFRSQ